MNCKPGEMAIIVKDGKYEKLAGGIVEVLHAAPLRVEFDLPDGVAHAQVTISESWVCKSLGAQFPSPFCCADIDVGFRMRLYAVIPDYALRPLRAEFEKIEERESNEAKSL